MLKILAAAALLMPLAGFAQNSGQPNENWTQVNLSVTDYHVIPGYADFASATGGLGEQARGFCAAPSPEGLQMMRQTYHQAMDAWEGIQHLQFGPITYFNWNYRLQYWPDERGTGGRQLEALIASGEEAQLEPQSFARASVGVQGFPALERLLFAEDALADLREEPFRCRVMAAIAANIESIAADVRQRWVDEFRATVASADERGFFESSQDATVDFLKALVETLPKLRDQKLDAPLGESFEAARARRAESWRSERSLRNLKINLAALERMFSGPRDGEAVSLASVFHAGDRQAILEQFNSVGQLLDGLPDSMVVALEDQQLYRQVTELQSRVDALWEAMEAALKNTDLYLGFNSLDGD